MGGLNANKDLNIILQYLNPTGNAILRKPGPDSDSKKTRTKRKPGLGLGKNPNSSSRKAGLVIRKAGLEIEKNQAFT